MTENPRLPIHAATGTALTARSWQTEAPLRMLMNNLDPEVAERPEDLVVYGGTGRAARSWEAFDAIVDTLRDLRAAMPDTELYFITGADALAGIDAWLAPQTSVLH